MARKKTATTKKNTSRRRRRSRIGAISNDSKSLLMQTVGGIAGAVIGTYVGNAVTTQVEKMDSLKDYAKYAGGAVQLVAGFLLPKLVKQKSPLMTGIQIGMMTNGGVSLVKSAGILPGVAGISDYYVPMIGATTQMDVRSSYIPKVGEMQGNPIAMAVGM
jgi:hypothetical protein